MNFNKTNINMIQLIMIIFQDYQDLDKKFVVMPFVKDKKIHYYTKIKEVKVWDILNLKKMIKNGMTIKICFFYKKH